MNPNQDELDLVYILGDGSDWDDNEIRYSLRSAEQYFPHRNVFVIGDCPSWLQNVIHIRYPDSYQIKTANGVSKVLRAAKDRRLTERFVLMNDDFFFLKKQRAVPYYYRGKTSEFIDRHRTKGGYYYQTLQNTEQFLIKQGKEPGNKAAMEPPEKDKKIARIWLDVIVVALIIWVIGGISMRLAEKVNARLDKVYESYRDPEPSPSPTLSQNPQNPTIQPSPSALPTTAPTEIPAPSSSPINKRPKK